MIGREPRERENKFDAVEKRNKCKANAVDNLA